MKLVFHKYHGTGNDFILIDNRSGNISLSQEQIAGLCDRHFGAGADGLMLLNTAPGYDFGMRYFNSDGRESTMCGNGGRCMVAFARSLGLIRRKAKFIAIDGEHYTEIIKESGNVTFVKLNMSNVETGKFKVRRLKSKIQNPKTKNQNRPSYVVLNTGSPHLVLFVDNATGIDLMADGRKLRYDPQFAPDGVNVDFVQVLEDGSLFVRTYERGVENETLSCGTGVTAAAIAFAVTNRRSLPLPQPLPKKGGEFSYQIISHCIKTLGGKLTVSFRQKDTRFSDIWLEGPAEFVFEGKI